MNKDFTTNPATERDLTIQELLLIKHMETIGALLRLIGKIAILEARINKLENEIEEMKSEDSWIVFNDLEEDLTLHGKTEPFFE